MGNVQQSSNLAAAMSNLAPTGPDAPSATGADHSTHQSSASPTTPPATAADGAVTRIQDHNGGDSIGLTAATADDYCTIQGLGEISLADAERLGFVEALVTGGYKVTSKAAYKEPAQAPQEEQHPDLAVEPLDAETEARLAEVVSKRPL